MRRVLAFCNYYTNIYRLLDWLLKTVVVFLLFYLNYIANSYFLGQQLIQNKARFVALQNALQTKKQLQDRAEQTEYHIHAYDRISKKVLHDIVKTGLSTVDNVDIVTSDIETVNAQETGLVSYQSFPLQFYHVTVVLRGVFQDIENFYHAIADAYPNEIFWKEVIFDASKYPNSQGAISFYVLAQ
ncbi:MAG: hypothetical protein VX112_02520 [Pseudomonadota bacterium]|nr:hypothetical protein [Pseudomonadota bacterium]